MSKISFFLITSIITLFYIFHFDKYLTEKFVVMNDFKKAYIKKSDSILLFTKKFFNQAQSIEELLSENEKLTQYQNLYTSSKHELDNVKESISSINPSIENIKMVKVLSYVNFDDFTKVWLDAEKTEDKIQGLIIGDYSAGIVIQKSDKAQALLNGNDKCNYAVYIGENKAPGIIHKNEKKQLLTVKFIPIWIDIKEGDEVITSGMDNIFFEGLKVGRVVKIKKMPDQQEAYIRPYAKVLQAKHFYLYDKIILNKKP